MMNLNREISDQQWHDFLLCWNKLDAGVLVPLSPMLMCDFWDDYITEKTDLDFVRICLVEKEEVLLRDLLHRRSYFSFGAGRRARLLSAIRYYEFPK